MEALMWPAVRNSSRILIGGRPFSPRILIGPSSQKKYSTQKQPQPKEVVPKEKIDLTKPTVVKWKRPPFIKRLFEGKFDTELLAFPEILTKENLSELEGQVKNICDLIGGKVNSTEIDLKQEVPDDFLQDLKDLGLFGRMIPAKYGGLDLTYTACTRVNEALGLDWSVSSILAAHEFLATQVILKFGSEEQKSFYLPKLASGNLIAALCCTELESGSDLLCLRTTASDTTDGNFVITGSKSWVSNAQLADLFVVFAKTPNTVDPKSTDVSVFLVEKGKGVTVVPQEKIGLRGLNTSHVHFDEVVIPPSNIIGLANGFQIYLNALESFRIASSTFTFGALKPLLDSVTDSLIHKERVDLSLADYEMVRKRLSHINAMIYGMESVSYFTAAILDSTDRPDIGFEAAALKVFNSKGTLFCLEQMMEAVGSSSLLPGAQLERFHRDARTLAMMDVSNSKGTLFCLEQMMEAVGSSSLLPGAQLERFYRDARTLAMMDSPNDMCQLFLGLSGCKMVEDKKAITLLYNPVEDMRHSYRDWKIRRRIFKFDQDIAGHIHPTLVEWGNEIEKMLQIFEVVVRECVAEHGHEIVLRQMEPIRIADIATELYVWTAVLSRASRSYCIGLTNSHHEIRLADAYCYDARDRVLLLLKELETGVMMNNDKQHLLLGEQVIDCQGYFPEHPLKHQP